MTADVREVADVRVEIFFAFRAAVLRIGDDDVNGPVGCEVAKVVKRPRENLVAESLIAAMRAWPFFV
jgi:hypothetical protein